MYTIVLVRVAENSIERTCLIRLNRILIPKHLSPLFYNLFEQRVNLNFNADMNHKSRSDHLSTDALVFPPRNKPRNDYNESVVYAMKNWDVANACSAHLRRLEHQREIDSTLIVTFHSLDDDNGETAGPINLFPYELY